MLSAHEDNTNLRILQFGSCVQQAWDSGAPGLEDPYASVVSWPLFKFDIAHGQLAEPWPLFKKSALYHYGAALRGSGAYHHFQHPWTEGGVFSRGAVSERNRRAPSI